MLVEIFPLSLKYGFWTTNKLSYDKKIEKKLVQKLVNKIQDEL